MNRQMLMKVIENSKFNNPRFSKCLKKWVPFICSSASKISWVTGRSDEDAIQDILVGIAEINQIYDVPLFKYKDRLYEKVREDGPMVLLRTPRNNKSKEVEMWVNGASVKEIKKGKLESTIYREINQQLVDIMNSHFTQKNGFCKEVKGEEFITVRSGKDKSSYSRKKVHKVTKMVDIVDDQEENLGWCDNSPEDNVIFNQYVREVKKEVSKTAGRVLDLMIKDPGISINEISETLEIDINSVMLSKCEIVRNLPFDSKIIKKCKSESLKPIYIRAN